MLRGAILKHIGFITLIFFLWMNVSADNSVGQQTVKKQEDVKTNAEKKEDKQPVFRVKVKEDMEKEKKRVPWLFIAATAVALGVIVYFLTQKKFVSEHRDVLYTGTKDPVYDINALGIEWKQIPAGKFLMGDNFNEGPSNNHPVHAVYLDTYYISKYEVTFAQYDLYCQERGINKPYDMEWGRGQMPVIFVNWQDCKDFCDWLSQKTGKNIHLPTDAQWEKAARGTDQRRYPWGNADMDCSLLNYNPCIERNKPVGSYPAGVSPYDVHDMAGNVAEWCQDYFNSTYYSRSPYRNPQGPETGGFRSMRGGSRGAGDYGHLSWIQSFSRTGNAFFRIFADVGFRIVWE